MSQTARFGETPLAVVDVETTGLFPSRADRVVEIAIVRTDAAGRTVSEYVTLVNPRRDIGPTSIHGLTAADVAEAPTFDEIAGDVAEWMSGAILVAHNAAFDTSFIGAEFERVGVRFPELPVLCTLELARRFAGCSASRKLSFLCREAGIAHEDCHSALGDARATAALLAMYLERATREGVRDLCALGCECSEVPEAWHSLRPSGRCLCRAEAAARQVEERTYLGRLVALLPGNECTSAPTAEYLNLLDRVLDDRIVSREEAEGLLASATARGLSRVDVTAAHRAYLSSLAAQAVADGIVTAAERRDLETVCDMLGLARSDLNAELAKSPGPAPAAAIAAGSEFSGKSVCFTGELIGRLRGQPIAREDAERLATEAGLVVKSGVTKKLDILVCADALTQSGKAKKAREYGIRIMAEPAFWRAIGVPVE